jgi:hypothetical protein
VIRHRHWGLGDHFFDCKLALQRTPALGGGTTSHSFGYELQIGDQRSKRGFAKADGGREDHFTICPRVADQAPLERWQFACWLHCDMNCKTYKIRIAWAAGDRIGALRIAARFFDRAADTKVFKRGMDAYNHPEFYMQLGKEPHELVTAALAFAWHHWGEGGPI